ncbi:hypothetical protein F5144DRAFT_572852 [Chaetomium tenue]|uniref:Uncharacterized protein n=1 Tax=Chaetomium tenue TaxID=1854479 RepID=A0ACB7P6U0_9PEZI|nr:hypothetical protein F5144DRAFT_572852 [Chaetomium globosum]
MPKPHRKACIACAESKRRCDQQLPECQRCIDRDIDCLYPQPKKRRRGDAASLLTLPQAGPLPLPIMQNPGVPAVSLGDWPAAGLGPGLDHIPLQPDTHDLISTTPLFGPLPGRGELSGNAASPWFLQEQTWVKEHQQPHGSAGVELDPFIHAVEGMLQSWVRTGHNSFIHERLYGGGMAPCLQDAFTTLAAYTTCTPAVKETILQIAEDRSSALACESLPNVVVGGGDGDGGAAAVRGHLACVHALFTYMFIRLFDGSVRARAAAEGQLPTLRRWLTQLWNAMQRYRNEYHNPGALASQETTAGISHNFSGHDYYDAATELWQLWILTESVRRSLIVIETIANVYECMVRGWAECTGAVMFTARAGLWEAKSAVKWLELSSVESPLLASSLCPERFISRYAAGEIDGFAKVVWGCAVGVDRMQCWIDGTAGTNRV